VVERERRLGAAKVVSRGAVRVVCAASLVATLSAPSSEQPINSAGETSTSGCRERADDTAPAKEARTTARRMVSREAARPGMLAVNEDGCVDVEMLSALSR
jgi:hypothetical protein